MRGWVRSEMWDKAVLWEKSEPAPWSFGYATRIREDDQQQEIKGVVLFHENERRKVLTLKGIFCVLRTEG